jgi:MoaA/NifB/PqqE/SkfB family radical SAM enzyme
LTKWLFSVCAIKHSFAIIHYLSATNPSENSGEHSRQRRVSEVSMLYDFEADWTLLNTCNYRCKYCFLPTSALGEKLIAHAEPQAWRRAFDRTGSTWLLHITGGEPTLYPDFAALCQSLTARHYLSFNSNLTHPSIVEVANSVDPSRIAFINAALHAEERETRKGLKKFLEHVAMLKERHFPIFISIVCTPDVLARIDYIISLTKPIGLIPVPKLLFGPCQGRVYPDAYSAKEKSKFIEFATRARAGYQGSRILRERPSIDVFGDDTYVHGIPWFRGRRCSAGEKFVSLQPDGKVYRCEAKQSNYLGNILDGSFQPRIGKSRCDSEYCYYFCVKYADGVSLSSAASQFSYPLVQKIRNSAAWRTVRPLVRPR